MASPNKHSVITPEALGRRIATAIREAPDDYRGNPTMVAGKLRISTDTLDNYIKGKGGGPGAVTVAQLAEITGKSFGWFAGERDPAPERLASVAERAQRDLDVMEQRLAAMLDELRLARAAVVPVDEAQIDRGVGRSGRKQATKKGGKAVAVPREASG